jgi:putative nucleotidyltransferase with HDIG domain
MHTSLVLREGIRIMDSFKQIFNEAPVSLWVEDFSAVKDYIDRLAADGVEDFATYLAQHPEQVQHCTSLVRLVDVNQATLTLYEADDKQAFLQHLATTFNEESLLVFTEELLALAAGKRQFQAEAMTTTLSGRTIATRVQLSIATGHEQDWGRVLVVMTDMEDLHQKTVALEQSNRALHLLSQCRALLSQACDEDTVLQQICDVASQEAGYALAWVGKKQSDSKQSVLPIAASGIAIGYLEGLETSWGDNPHGRGATGTAIREQRTVTSYDLKHNPAFAPWKALAQPYGFRDSIALPLVRSGYCYGAINLYTTTPHHFDDSEIRLLENLADDVAQTIQSLRIRALQYDTEQAVQHKQTQLMALLNNSREINRKLNIQAVMRVLVESAVALVHADSGAAGLMSQDVMVFKEYLQSGTWHQIDYTFHEDEGVPGYVMHHRVPYISDDATRDPHVIPEIQQMLNFHQLIDVPIINAQGTLLGCFEIHDRSNGEPFNDEDCELLQGLAASAAIALENSRLSANLKASLTGTISAIAKAVEMKDPYTGGHQQRVAKLAVAIAHVMGLNEHQIESIQLGATIHDIGKINVPAEIVCNPGPLSHVGYALVQEHCSVGYQILSGIDFPWPIADIALQHHEHIDGSGYPQGLKGEDICLEARIVTVADVVEAMVSHRPYRPSLGIDAALEELSHYRGQWYDANAVDACLHLFKQGLFHFEDDPLL